MKIPISTLDALRAILEQAIESRSEDVRMIEIRNIAHAELTRLGEFS